MKISRAKVLVAVTAYAKAQFVPQAFDDVKTGRVDEVNFDRMYLESSIVEVMVVTLSKSMFQGSVVLTIAGTQRDGQVVKVGRECESILAVCKFIADVIEDWTL
ncbi:hypothetical protein CPT_Saba_006 [Proteus phage Saba]|uniref:Uncharacterized protein n=1 Tax=Proteus phage Saba TaxID=2596672 RepID=A0A5B9N710_9CAUD|nr:hypothetical protein JT320_gp06 [Proteus phage Saba]QEG09379.1 hypothetical protein CPT_Saba_006 [Proteus phage Saba]